jgi:hypothetical protein
MHLHPRRPRKPEYRNTCRALMLALGQLYVHALPARRAIRAALDGGGLDYALLALRTTPQTFGAVRPAADRKDRETAAQAVSAFARARECCTRPLMRDAADLLRPGIVAQADDRERRAAREAAYDAEEAWKKAEQLRKNYSYVNRECRDAAERVYLDPEAAVKAAFRFGKVHGPAVLWTESHKHPLRFGWMRWYPLLDHLRGRFGFRLVAGQGEPLVTFRHYAKSLVELSGDVPSAGRVAELLAAAKAAAAAEAALGPAPPEVDRDLWKAPRRAAGPVLDAMRLISPRFPEDAAPEVRRQLVVMLPPGADQLIDRAIQLAQTQHREDERRGPHPHFARGR